MHGAPLDCKNVHQSGAVGTACLPHHLPLSPLGLIVLGVGWCGAQPGVEAGRVYFGVLMPLKPQSRVLLERSHHHQT